MSTTEPWLLSFLLRVLWIWVRVALALTVASGGTYFMYQCF